MLPPSPILGPHTPIVRLPRQFPVRDQLALCQNARLLKSLDMRESDEVITYPLLESGQSERVWFRLPPGNKRERTLTVEAVFVNVEVAQSFTEWLQQ